MIFRPLDAGYYIAESDATEDTYVIRTRPKGDGWMSIAESDGIVIATGMTRREAMTACEVYDNSVYAEMLRDY